MTSEKATILREIPTVRQIAGEQRRRWFTSETLDLLVWIDEDGLPAGFQLSVDKGGVERAVTWTPQSGLLHATVDDGESAGNMRHKAAPILTAAPKLDCGRVAHLFREAAIDIPNEIRDFVITTLVSNGASAEQR